MAAIAKARILGLMGCVLSSAPLTLAQCAMCRASIANSDDPAKASAAVNAGILVLLIPTLMMIFALVSLVLRYHRADSKN